MIPQFFLRLLFSIFFVLVLHNPLLANTSDQFNDRIEISDGEDGRQWKQWSRRVQEKTVVRVVARLKKVRGGNDTFVNLRYANGNSFENGKQVFLRDNNLVTASWNVNEKPNSRPLVLNAYKGVVQIINIQVFYAQDYSESRDPGYQQPRGPRPRGSGVHNVLNQNKPADGREVRICQRGNYSYPDIEISKTKTSGRVFSGKYRIHGAIAGSCIEEAGYYEKGKLKHKLEMPYSSRFQRKEFGIQVRSGRGGEIRVYTTNGSQSRIEVDSYISDSRNNSNNSGAGGWQWPQN